MNPDRFADGHLTEVAVRGSAVAARGGDPADPDGWFLQRRDRLAGPRATRVWCGNCVFQPAVARLRQ